MATGNVTGTSAIQRIGFVMKSDFDTDGLPDRWERRHTTSLGHLTSLAAGPGPGAGSGDFDADGLTDQQEYTRSLNGYPDINPVKKDTDGDTLDDKAELTGIAPRPATDPTLTDTDGDGLTDTVETNTGTYLNASNTGTNPARRDTDGDGSPDQTELTNGGNPLNSGVLPAPFLAAWWPFDTDGYSFPDHSGHGNTLVSRKDGNGVSAPWVHDQPRNSGVISLAADSPLLTLTSSRPSPLLAQTYPDNMTLTAWINPVNLTQHHAIIGKTVGNALPAPFDLYLRPGGVPRFYAGDGAASLDFVDGVTPFQAGQWHHLAVVIRGTTVTFYRDGVQDATGALDAIRKTGIPTLHVGNRLAKDLPMAGRMDDVAIFNGVLSPEQINRVKSGNFSEFNPAPPAVRELRINSFFYDTATGRIQIDFQSTMYQPYQLERSENLRDWAPSGQPRIGGFTGTDSIEGNAGSARRLFFRVIPLP